MLEALWKVAPDAQAVQRRSLVAVPGALTKEPAPHVLKTAHAPFPASALNLPVGQGAHTRSEVLVGAVACSVPAGQTVCATHRSPLWKVPAVHGLQRVSLLGVGAATTASPGLHVFTLLQVVWPT